MVRKKKTRPQDRWDERACVRTASYKLPIDVIESYKETCRRLGVSMGPQLAEMMQRFIDANTE